MGLMELRSSLQQWHWSKNCIAMPRHAMPCPMPVPASSTGLDWTGLTCDRGPDLMLHHPSSVQTPQKTSPTSGPRPCMRIQAQAFVLTNPQTADNTVHWRPGKERS